MLHRISENEEINKQNIENNEQNAKLCGRQ